MAVVIHLATLINTAMITRGHRDRNPAGYKALSESQNRHGGRAQDPRKTDLVALPVVGERANHLHSPMRGGHDHRMLLLGSWRQLGMCELARAPCNPPHRADAAHIQ